MLFRSHRALGLQGIQLAQPAADVLTGLISLPFMLYFLKATPNDEDILSNTPADENHEKEIV